MPGDVQPSFPVGVMPLSLCTLYSESREYAQLQIPYHDGTIQRSQLAQTSRKTWKQNKKLTSAQLATLKAFYDSCNGGLARFWFYDVFAVCPVASNYDSTGANPIGRYIVCFRNDWQQATGILRTDVQGLELIEVGSGSAIPGAGGEMGPVAGTITLTVWGSHTANNQDSTIHGSPNGAWNQSSGVFNVPTGGTRGSAVSNILGGTDLSQLAISFELDYSGGLIHVGDPGSGWIPESWNVYDAYVTVPYASGSVNYRPLVSFPNNEAFSSGQVLLANLANDADSNPPVTFAKVQRWHFSNLSSPANLALSNFTVPF